MASKARVRKRSVKPTGVEILDKTHEVQLTVNLMELIAVDLGCQLIAQLRRHLRKTVITTNLWTDSRCAIEWLKGTTPKQNKTFIRNKVQTISSTRDVQVRHIPGKQNPADILSRGSTIDELLDHELWEHGPKLLTTPNEWPTPLLIDEIRKQHETVQIKAIRQLKHNTQGQPVIDVPQSEARKQAVQPDAWVAQTLIDSTSFKEAVHKTKEHLSTIQNIDVSSTDASLYIIKQDQKTNPPSKDLIKQKLLYCENDIWYAKNRLQPTDKLIYVDRYSKILPLMIADMHDVVHPNQVTTWRKLTEQIQFVGGQKTVKRAIREGCEVCRIALTSPYPRPNLPPLPNERVQLTKPFENVGVDLAGPFSIKSTKETKKPDVKVHIVVYTCLASRATALDLIMGSSAEHFMQSFRRFKARHGLPKQIFSDNATYFGLWNKTLQKVLAETIDDNTITQDAHECRWTFTTERASFKGGVYESIVKIIKNCLHRSLHKHNSDVENLRTMITEIEDFLNSRPIIAEMMSDSEPRPIRPIDLIMPRKQSNWRPIRDETESDPDFQVHTTNADHLLKQFKHTNNQFLEYKERFEKEYLPLLRRIPRRTDKEDSTSKLKFTKGQVILVQDENQKNRNLWPTAVIKDLKYGPDGICRTLILKDGNRTYKRAPEFCYKLEFDQTVEDKKNDKTISVKFVRLRQTNHYTSDSNKMADDELLLDLDDDLELEATPDPTPKPKRPRIIFNNYTIPKKLDTQRNDNLEDEIAKLKNELRKKQEDWNSTEAKLRSDLHSKDKELRTYKETLQLLGLMGDDLDMVQEAQMYSEPETTLIQMCEKILGFDVRPELRRLTRLRPILIEALRHENFATIRRARAKEDIMKTEKPKLPRNQLEKYERYEHVNNLKAREKNRPRPKIKYPDWTGQPMFGAPSPKPPRRPIYEDLQQPGPSRRYFRNSKR